MGTKRIKIKWMPYAKNDLREIGRYIAEDNTYQAKRIIQIIRWKPDYLRTFPEFGQVVEEIKKENIREIHCFSWRIIYRYKKNEHLIQILTVFHSARELNKNIISEITKENFNE